MRRLLAAALSFILLSAQAPAPDAAHVLAFLNRTIAWYQRLDVQAQWADQPTDVLYVNDDRQLARQVVALSFEAAKATEPFVAATAGAPPQQRTQRLAQRASSAAEVLHREQARAAELQRRLALSSAADRARLEAAVAEAQSRVAMAQVRNDAVSGVAGFANGTTGSDLASQIADAIDRQHRDMERLLGISTAPPRPHTRLRVAPNGIEIRTRYPVEIESAGTIDDRVAAAVAGIR